MSLPDDILVRVFFFIPLDQLLLNVSLVCKRFYQLCHHPQLWKVFPPAGFCRPMYYNRSTVSQISAHSQHLRNIKLTGSFDPSFRSGFLEDLLASFHHIRYLDLTQNQWVRSLSFLTSMPRIEKLIIDHCCKIDPEGAAGHLSSCKQITFLSMYGCSQFERANLLDVIKQIPIIEYLNMEDCCPLDCNDTLTVLTSCPELSAIQLTPAHHHGNMWLSTLSQRPTVTYEVALKETMNSHQWFQLMCTQFSTSDSDTD